MVAARVERTGEAGGVMAGFESDRFAGSPQRDGVGHARGRRSPVEPPVALVLSDIHIGDRDGVVSEVPREGYGATPEEGIYVRNELLEMITAVDRLLAGARELGGAQKVPALILNGDAWDVAIRTISDVAALSQRFFAAVELERRFDQILFVPGNHDHYLWTVVQTQTCVVRPLENARGSSEPGSARVRPFPHAQCGRLVSGGDAGPRLSISGVREPYTGNVFVTGLTGGRLPVNVVYPNLYVVPREGRGTTVVTHGHFFQLAWSLLSEVLGPSVGTRLSGMGMAKLELLNASLTDFVNYSLAQVGPLSDVFNRIYVELRSGRTPPELLSAMERLRDVLDEVMTFEDQPRFAARAKEAGTDAVLAAHLWVARKLLEAQVRRSRSASVLPSGRIGEEFLGDRRALERLESFLDIVRTEELPGEPIAAVVLGHTHEPVGGIVVDVGGAGPIAVWNAGSLVGGDGRCAFLPLAIAPDGVVRAFPI